MKPKKSFTFYLCHLDCAYELLNARGLSGAPVLGPNGELVGVLTIRDLVRLAGGILTPDHEPSATGNRKHSRHEGARR